MIVISLSGLLMLSLMGSTISQLYTNIINTTSGEIQGTTIYFNNKRVEQYLGIPFAEPPVGQLRFQKPHPVKPWLTRLLAHKPKPACVQFSEYPFPWYAKYNSKSEDCLYLNIWVPQSNQNNGKKPVLFWIYGGGYKLGSNQMPIYDGLALASEGDIIVVTTNYRLSSLGFLTTPSETAPGNVALYDILEALKWVNANIHAFGGDPHLVTVAGESVGAMTAGTFCFSPLTKGLFKRVIMESGSPTFLQVENNTALIEKSQKLAETLGCADEVFTVYNSPNKVVDCLRRNKTAFEIIFTEYSFHYPANFQPHYGDELVPVNPKKALLDGTFHNVDVLIGNNQDEGSLNEAISNLKVFGAFGLNNPKINKTYGEHLIDEFFKDFPAKDEVKEYYLGNLRETDYDEIREQVYTAMGDFLLLCPTKYFAEIYGQSGKNVYFYFFIHRPSTTPWAKWMKVVHFEEVQFVFGQPLLNPAIYTRDEVYLSSKMIRIWSNFVKYGSPAPLNQQGAVRGYWPLYSKTHPRYFTLSTNAITYGDGPHQENCDFFRPYFEFF